MNLGFDPHQLTPLCHIMYKYGSDKGNINLRFKSSGKFVFGLLGGILQGARALLELARVGGGFERCRRRRCRRDDRGLHHGHRFDPLNRHRTRRRHMLHRRDRQCGTFRRAAHVRMGMRFGLRHGNRRDRCRRGLKHDEYRRRDFLFRLQPERRQYAAGHDVQSQ